MNKCSKKQGKEPTHEQYLEARRAAQKKANESGFDQGLEWNALFGQFHTFGLPGVGYRFGHELRCEVVMAENLETCQKGHGPLANRGQHYVGMTRGY